MIFEEAYEGFQNQGLTQDEEAGLSGVCGRSFEKCDGRIIF